MQTEYLYSDTYIYMALYLKKLYTNSPTVYVTQQELESYKKLINDELERQVALSGGEFSYQILNGEPNYRERFNLATESFFAELNTAKYAYDPVNKIYYSSSNEKALSYKSICVPNQVVRPSLTPNGYEKVLGLKKNTNGNKRVRNALKRSAEKLDETGTEPSEE